MCKRRKLKLSLIFYWKLLLRFQALEEKGIISLEEPAQLGKVKTEYIKRLAKELMERFPDKFSSNFNDNKHTVDAITEGTTTKVRNQVAGYITHSIASTQSNTSNENEDELSA